MTLPYGCRSDRAFCQLRYRQWLTDLYPQLFTAAPMLHRAESKGLPVLDCGAGTSVLILALHQITPLPLQLHGVDVAPKMVGAARRRLAAGATLQTKVHYRQGDSSQDDTVGGVYL